MQDGIKGICPKVKGKGIDPHEWGAVELDNKEMDLEMQEHILWNYSRKQKRKGLPEEVVAFDLSRMSRHKSIALSGHAKPIKYKRAGSTPVSQIIPDSSLGVALREITMNNNLPSSSDPDSSSDQELDYSREDRPHRRRQLRKRPSQKTGSPTIRLIPPKEYDGSADARAYH